ncbi:MAG: hypothetical protein GEV11_07905 [Streptosporangiales bacterium]|nr:hypothetical protein [Streptosporangiales bacterium]
MDLNTMARLTAELPERFADRVDPATAKHLHTIARGGETGELLDLLLHVLREDHASITTAERDELAALLTACEMPTKMLDGIHVG